MNYWISLLSCLLLAGCLVAPVVDDETEERSEE